MYKIAVMGDRDSTLGFKALGLEVCPVATPEEGRELLHRMAKENYAIIYMTEQLASQLSPYILIVQLLFSGVLFPMEGASSTVSALMLSRWGMEALGSISNLNDLPLRLQAEFPMIPHEADDAFLSTTGHLLMVWLVLMLFVLVPLFLGNFALHGVKKDSRG